jgi:uncharacterized SAM-binding protein YcdF (DUF218 family)
MNSASLPEDKKIVEAAHDLWDYMKLRHVLKPVDIILVPCNRDDRVADYAAQLYKQGLGKYVLVSGGISPKNDLLKSKWNARSEAHHFAEILLRHGLPRDSILIEPKATNTGENIRLSYQLLIKKKIYPHSILLLQKPYMERRTYATFIKQWPGEVKKVLVSSPPYSLQEYITEDQPFELVVNIMIGDLQRIIEYPKLGYQIYQKVPQNVLKAYDYLLKQGFNKRLIQQ